MNRAVFLDRDGVLNRAIVREGRPYPPHSLDDFELLPGAERLVWTASEANFLTIVVTNQPDVARGTQSRETVETMNQHLASVLPLDDILVCYHDSADDCDCRKPKPGLLYQAAERWSIDLASSVLVGDRWRDVEAGLRAGCRTVFIDYRYDERLTVQPDATVSSVVQAADLLLSLISLEPAR